MTAWEFRLISENCKKSSIIVYLLIKITFSIVVLARSLSGHLNFHFDVVVLLFQVPYVSKLQIDY